MLTAVLLNSNALVGPAHRNVMNVVAVACFLIETLAAPLGNIC